MEQEYQGKYLKKKVHRRKWRLIGLLVVIALAGTLAVRYGIGHQPEVSETEPSLPLLESVSAVETEEVAVDIEPTQEAFLPPETQPTTEPAQEEQEIQEETLPASVDLALPTWKNDKKLTTFLCFQYGRCKERYFSYNDKGLLAKISNDPPHQETSDTYREEIHYDDQDRMKEFWVCGALEMDYLVDVYNYNELGQLVSRNHSNTAGLEAQITYTYDAQGQLAERSATMNSDEWDKYMEVFSRDANGRISSSQACYGQDGDIREYTFRYDDENLQMNIFQGTDQNPCEYYPMEYRFFYSVTPQLLRYMDENLAITDQAGAMLWYWEIGKDAQIQLDEDGYPFKIHYADTDTTLYFLYNNEPIPQTVLEERNALDKSLSE